MTYLPAAHDPYLIPGTDVLRNLAGASSSAELAAVENDLCTARSIELHRRLPKAEGTLVQLRWIHRQLFRDVYDWAGEIRVIDMAKGDGEPFQPLEFFDMGVIYSERVLREDNLLRGMTFETFVERLSVSYNNFNILHPFREGNGRAQRVFWDVVARDAGWHFDWGLVGRRENDMASIAAMRSNDLGLWSGCSPGLPSLLPNHWRPVLDSAISWTGNIRSSPMSNTALARTTTKHYE